MSQEDVDLVRRMQEAFLGPDPERALTFFDTDVEYDARERPDGRVWHGRSGVRAAMIEWGDAWDDWQVETERYLEAADGKVLIMWRERGRGKGSGVPMEQRGANVVTVRNGRIVHVRLYVHQLAALKAAGLED